MTQHQILDQYVTRELSKKEKVFLVRWMKTRAEAEARALVFARAMEDPTDVHERIRLVTALAKGAEALS